VTVLAGCDDDACNGCERGDNAEDHGEDVRQGLGIDVDDVDRCHLRTPVNLIVQASDFPSFRFAV
jgi:hypothetical protein